MTLRPRPYYLKGGEDWLAATDLKGPWQQTGKLPEALKTLMAQAEKAAPRPGRAQKGGSRGREIAGDHRQHRAGGTPGHRRRSLSTPPFRDQPSLCEQYRKQYL